MSNPIVMFESHAASAALAGVTANSEAAGYPGSNIRDWRSSSNYQWRTLANISTATVTIDLGSGVTKAADTYVLARHNLKTLGWQHKVEYSSDGSSWSTPTGGGNLTATTDGAIMRRFTSPGAFRYWRLTFSHPSSTLSGAGVFMYLGILTLGRRLEFPEGPQAGWDPFGSEALTTWNQNGGGYLLGSDHAYVERPIDIVYGEPGIADTYFRGSFPNIEWDWIRDHAKSLPWWWAWNQDYAPDDIYLARLDGPVEMPLGDNYLRRTLNVKARTVQF